MPKRKIGFTSNNDSKTKTPDENIKNEISNSEDLQIPVDKECKLKLNKATIFKEGSDVYDVMLNQTNLQFNNNKFYLIQLLKDNDSNNFSVWMRWARVGKVGQTKLEMFNDDLVAAKKCFCKKFYEKTRNNWPDRLEFKKVEGKYDLVHIDYKEDKNENNSCLVKEKKVKLELLECKLEDKVQDLLKMIFNIAEMDSAASDLHYDTGKLPLGRLTESQIRLGYTALGIIEKILKDDATDKEKLLAACNDYYTRIPHDFGMKVPPMIRSVTDIKRELELLEALSDMKIALNLLELGDSDVHPLDRQYNSLNCDIKALDLKGETYKLIDDYLVKTHGSTHSNYSLEMIDLYEVRKKPEWDDFVNHGNNMLLWHGSRTTNYGGILGQGLRIAPPEAPVTGYMFGKGIYFADISSKSANYIYSTPAKNVGFLLLCEVSLGNLNSLTKADSNANNLPQNKQSVKGCGMIESDPGTWVTMSDGVVVPVGLPRDTGLAKSHKGYLLNYNEYIVYNVKQVRMRYMVKVKFRYK